MVSVCRAALAVFIIMPLSPAISTFALAQQTDPNESDHSAPEYPGFKHLGSTHKSAVGMGSGPSFATSIHVELVESVKESMACTEVLARAQWRQDILLALDAKAHYDNCQFDTTNSYVEQLVNESVSAAREGRRDAALSAMGRALHAVQDFYSHSNYLELSLKKYGSLTEVPVLAVWTPEGRGQLIAMAGAGLVSGQVWWEPGNACASPSVTHAQLNKDTPASPNGEKLISEWGVTNHQAARELARRATLEFIRHMFAKSEMQFIAEDCKGQIGVLLLDDNRKGLQ